MFHSEIEITELELGLARSIIQAKEPFPIATFKRLSSENVSNTFEEEENKRYGHLKGTRNNAGDTQWYLATSSDAKLSSSRPRSSSMSFRMLPNRRDRSKSIDLSAIYETNDMKIYNDGKSYRNFSFDSELSN